MHQDGRLPMKPYIQFVLGVKNATPVDKDIFDYYVKTMQRIAPESEWCAAGIGRHQSTVNEWAISAGGHTRTGLEDNIRIDRNNLAKSNAALVEIAVDLCGKYERPLATWKQARSMLGLN